jgi:hypothetical protein
MPKRIAPTRKECYSLTRPEAEELATALKAKGYWADTTSSGACHTDADGQHWHPVAVIVYLSPAQARRLAGLK